VPPPMSSAQRAMRLFAVLIAGCEKLADSGADGETAMFKGETRLHALMFWLRNPDYLAWELLELHAATGDAALIARVRAMLAEEEPILRRDAMPKWRFGAYDPIDTEMAILTSRRLVRTVHRPVGPKSAENSFLLFPAAFQFEGAVAGNLAYQWYADRMRIVMQVAGDRPGYDLKDKQYKHIEYAKTPGHGLIPPITQRVEDRLRSIEGRG
jgi:hypothetical protein